jgi:hypothetical protein
MKKIKDEGGYELVFSEIDNEYQIYSGEEMVGAYDNNLKGAEEANKDFNKLVGESEIINNEKYD